MGVTSATVVAAGCIGAVDEQRERPLWWAAGWPKAMFPCTRAPLIVKRWQGYGGHPRQAQAVDWPLRGRAGSSGTLALACVVLARCTKQMSCLGA